MESRKRVGYSFWGYLADLKFTPDGRLASAPDGNFSYSWSVINGFRDIGYDVVHLGIDRDYDYVCQNGLASFSSFCTAARYDAYRALETPSPMKGFESSKDYALIDEDMFIRVWEDCGYQDLEFILHEWRMPTVRNNENARAKAIMGAGNDYCPDRVIQNAVIRFCRKHNIPLIVFDLSYLLTVEEFMEIKDVARVVELGSKWENCGIPELASRAFKVYIPMDVDLLMDEGVRNNVNRPYPMIYVGNRYERDDSIRNLLGTPEAPEWVLCGRWEPEWVAANLPNATLTGRIQSFQVCNMHRQSTATIVLAKPDYYRYGFVAERLIEAVFFGCIPVFPLYDGVNEYSGYREEIVRQYTALEGYKDFTERLTITEGYKRWRWDFPDMAENRQILAVLRSNIMMLHSQRKFASHIDSIAHITDEDR